MHSNVGTMAEPSTAPLSWTSADSAVGANNNRDENDRPREQLYSSSRQQESNVQQPATEQTARAKLDTPPTAPREAASGGSWYTIPPAVIARPKKQPQQEEGGAPSVLAGGAQANASADGRSPSSLQQQIRSASVQQSGGVPAAYALQPSVVAPPPGILPSSIGVPLHDDALPRAGQKDELSWLRQRERRDGSVRAQGLPSPSWQPDEAALSLLPDIAELTILWYGTIDKIARNMQAHTRVLFVTDKAVYVCLPAGGVTRTIAPERLVEVVVAPPAVATFRVDGEQDLVIATKSVEERSSMLDSIKTCMLAKGLDGVRVVQSSVVKLSEAERPSQRAATSELANPSDGAISRQPPRFPPSAASSELVGLVAEMQAQLAQQQATIAQLQQSNLAQQPPASKQNEADELRRDLEHSRALIADLQVALRSQEGVFAEMLRAQESMRVAEDVRRNLEQQLTAAQQERDMWKAKASQSAEAMARMEKDMKQLDEAHKQELDSVRKAFAQYDEQVGTYLEALRQQQQPQPLQPQQQAQVRPTMETYCEAPRATTPPPMQRQPSGEAAPPGPATLLLQRLNMYANRKYQLPYDHPVPSSARTAAQEVQHSTPPPDAAAPEGADSLPLGTPYNDGGGSSRGLAKSSAGRRVRDRSIL